MTAASSSPGENDNVAQEGGPSVDNRPCGEMNEIAVTIVPTVTGCERSEVTEKTAQELSERKIPPATSAAVATTTADNHVPEAASCGENCSTADEKKQAAQVAEAQNKEKKKKLKRASKAEKKRAVQELQQAPPEDPVEVERRLKKWREENLAPDYYDNCLKKKDEQEEERPKELHIAPMLDVTTREFRTFMRILSKKQVLWTEMVVDGTINHCADLEEHLGFCEHEHPIVMQLGGNDPASCAKAALAVAKRGYTEINLNCGCPSDRVSGKGEFGASLMLKPTVVKNVMGAIREILDKNGFANVETSVKTRIGVDVHDSIEFVLDFINTLRPVCKKFYIHARKCILMGLTPAQNRSIPPLNYERVVQICETFPDCNFYLNGGITDLKIAKEWSNRIFNMRGAMLGRAAMDTPCIFADADRYFYGCEENPCSTRRELLEKYCCYLDKLIPPQVEKLPDIPLVVDNGGAGDTDQDEEVANNLSEKKPVSSGNSIVQQHVIEQKYADLFEKTLPSRTPESEINTELVMNKKMLKKRLESKITAGEVCRAMKPLIGLFHGLPGTRNFRRELDRLCKSLEYRDCGPGFILRYCYLRNVPDEILDAPLARTGEVCALVEANKWGRSKVGQLGEQHQSISRGNSTVGSDICACTDGAVGGAEVSLTAGVDSLDDVGASEVAEGAANGGEAASINRGGGESEEREQKRSRVEPEE